MTDRRRFLFIEERREDTEPQSETADRGRIAAILGSVPPANEEEFRFEIDPSAPLLASDLVDVAPVELRPADKVVSSVEPIGLDDSDVAAQPFVRCVRCVADNTIHATTCVHCGTMLDTREQRAWNERVWEAQKREHEREAKALAELAAARLEQKRAATRPLPEGEIELPQELTVPIDETDRPMLFDIVVALVKPQWHRAIGASVLVVPILLVAFGGSFISKIGIGLFILVLITLLPRSFGRRVFDWIVRH